MWENDCGVLPVVSEEGEVVGLITDRDICMAAALKGEPLANISVEDTTTGRVFACEPDDDVRTALETMQENRVRRLPVVSADGMLQGLLSLNDIVLKAELPRDKKTPDISFIDVVNAYKSISQHRAPAVQAQAASGS
jgi:predicted transcriptional regulator